MVDDSLPMPEKIGRYELLSELGRGGMAVVYLAKDPHFKRDVALKLLPPQMMLDPTFRQRFRREAETVATLEHPAIVPVYDFGEQDGYLFLVMQLMSGGTLADKLDNGPLPLREVVKITERIGLALDRAHQMGIIHRDLKPGNILFDKYDDAYLADFGIARLAESNNTLTGTGLIGTPAYMSPEQIEGKPVDGRSDIYALGIIIFEMLTGKKPYDADTPAMMLVKQITEPVPYILDVEPDLPPTVEAAVLKAMAKKVDDRFEHAKEIAPSLKGETPITLPGAREVQTLASQPKEQQSDAQQSEKKTVASTPSEAAVDQPDQTTNRQQKRPLWHYLAAGGILLLVIVGILIAINSGNDPVIENPNETENGENDPQQNENNSPSENPSPNGMLPSPNEYVQIERFGRGTVDTIRLSPNGEMVVAGGSLGVWLYDSGTLEPVTLFQGHTDQVRDVVFSPVGSVVASASWDKTIRLWDIETEEQTAVFNGQDQYLSIDWSADGQLIAAGSWLDFIEIWDVENGQLVKEIPGLEASTTHLAWSPDGEWLAAGGDNGRVLVWNRATGTVFNSFQAHEDDIGCLTWSPTSAELITCGLYDNLIRAWLPLDGKIEPSFETSAHEFGTFAAAWSEDGTTLITTGGDNAIRLWNTTNGNMTREIETFKQTILAMTPIYEREVMVVLSSGGQIFLTEMNSLEIIAQTDEHTKSMWSIGWSRNDQLAAASSDATVHIRDAETGELLHRLQSDQEAWDVFDVSWSFSGEELAVGWDNGTFDVWDAVDWFADTYEMSESITAVAWSPDEDFIGLATIVGEIIIWNVEEEREETRWKAYDDVITDLAWSPNGEWLASSSRNNTATVWEFDGTLVTIFEEHTDEVTAVAWSPDSKRVATSSFDITARVWDAETGEQHQLFDEHFELITDIAWSPDGNLIASTGWDQVVRVWEYNTGVELDKLEGHVGPVLGVAWSPDGQAIASSSQDGTVIIWGAEQ